MSNEITTNFVDKFNTNLQLLSQQLPSRFRNAVVSESQHGEGAVAVEQFGAVTAQLRTARHSDAPVIETPSARRWEHPLDYDWGDLVDREDKLRILISPEGAMTRNGLGAINRAMDDEVVRALHGTALTGRSAGTSTTLPAGNIVAVTFGAGSTDTGMNTEKLLEARRLILNSDVDLDDPMNQLYCAIGPQQEKELLDQVKVVNKDYQDNAVLDSTGTTLKSWFGINFIVTTRLVLDTNSDRECALWAKSGMHLGVWSDVTGNIVVRNDKTRQPFYVSTSGTFGATRTEEEKVMQILCDES